MKMPRSRLIRRCAAAAIAIAAAGLTAATPSVAAAPDFDTGPLPAGLACPDFALQIIGVGDSRHTQVFTNGRVISAGKGFTLTFINLDNTDKTLTLQSNGSVEKRTPNGDGTSTVASLGHNVIVLFPTDTPAGPSTTLYVGSVFYTVVERTQEFTILRHSGTTTDICAALA